MKKVDANIVYNLEFVIKDRKNYDFPCNFASIQFVEIEPYNLENKPSKRVHFEQIKNIIISMNNKDLNIPYKYSTIGKLISKNFKEDGTRMVFGDFKGIGLDLNKNLDKFKEFIQIIKQLKHDQNEKRVVNTNKTFKGFSLINIHNPKLYGL